MYFYLLIYASVPWNYDDTLTIEFNHYFLNAAAKKPLIHYFKNNNLESVNNN